MSEDAPQSLIWGPDELRRFWAYYSQFPETYFSFQSGSEVIRDVAAYLPKNGRVLDYGCGPGFLIGPLLRAGFQVTAADFSMEVVGDISKRFSDQKGFVGAGTIDELLDTKDSFDALFLLEVVEHLYNEQLMRTLDNARTLLRSGGMLIVTTPNEERLEDSMVYCPVSNVTFHRWQHVRRWDARTLAEWLSRHGFDVVSVRTKNFPSAAARGTTVRSMASRLLDRMRRHRNLIAIARRR